MTNSASFNILVSAIENESISSYLWSLDDGEWVEKNANEPIILNGLNQEKTYRLAIKGKNSAGLQAVATVVQWSYDAGVVEALLSGLPLNPTNATTTNIQISGEGITNYKYKLDNGSWSAQTPVRLI